MLVVLWGVVVAVDELIFASTREPLDASKRSRIRESEPWWSLRSDEIIWVDGTHYRDRENAKVSHGTDVVLNPPEVLFG